MLLSNRGFGLFGDTSVRYIRELKAMFIRNENFFSESRFGDIVFFNSGEIGIVENTKSSYVNDIAYELEVTKFENINNDYIYKKKSSYLIRRKDIGEYKLILGFARPYYNKYHVCIADFINHINILINEQIPIVRNYQTDLLLNLMSVAMFVTINIPVVDLINSKEFFDEVGWVKDKFDKYYYIKNGCKVKKKFEYIDGAYYYFDGYGVLKQGLIDYKGETFYGGEYGFIVQDTFMKIEDGSMRYFGSVGSMAKLCYVKDLRDEKLYYADDNGILIEMIGEWGKDLDKNIPLIMHDK
jgi:FOG: glucan-binding domain (YG repeat)